MQNFKVRRKESLSLEKARCRILSKKLTTSLLFPPLLPTTPLTKSTSPSSSGSANLPVLLVPNSHSNSRVEDVFHANVFFGAALHVLSAHFLSNTHALLWCDGCESLSFQKIYTGFLVAQV
jgi:hypothetical protein